MAQTELTIKMDEEVAAQASALFGELGMDLETAVNVFVRQALREQGMPCRITLQPRRHGRPGEVPPPPRRHPGEVPPPPEPHPHRHHPAPAPAPEPEPRRRPGMCEDAEPTE